MKKYEKSAGVIFVFYVLLFIALLIIRHFGLEIVLDRIIPAFTFGMLFSLGIFLILKD